MEIQNAYDFNHWQFSNANKLGFDKIKLGVKMALSFRQIEELFLENISTRQVNPLTDEDNTPIAYAFYEYCTDFCGEWNPPDKLKDLKAAVTYFSWQYPQLKMVCHDVVYQKETSSDAYFLSEIIFVLEFME